MFKERIKAIIAEQGNNIICERRLVYMLDDYGEFENVERPIRRIMLNAIEGGYARQLLQEKEWGLHTQTICQKFIDDYGVKEAFAITVFRAVAYGLGLKMSGDSVGTNSQTRLTTPDVNSSIQSHKYLTSDKSMLSVLRSKLVDVSSNGLIRVTYPYLSEDIESKTGKKYLNLSIILKGWNTDLCSCLFSYTIYNKNGSVMECDKVNLSRTRADKRRIISEIAKGKNWSEIERIEYKLTVSDVRPAKYPQANPSVSNNCKVQINHRKDIEKKEGVTTGFLTVIERYNWLDFKFSILHQKDNIQYYFNYKLYNSNGGIIEEERLILRKDYKGTRLVEECGKGNLSRIVKVECYLSK